MRRWVMLLVPGAVLTAAAAVLSVVRLPPEWRVGVQNVYPMAVLLAGTVLGWRFNRSRLVLAILALGAAERSLYLAASAGVDSLPYQVVAAAVSIVLPAHLVFLALARDYGVISFRGICRFMALAVLFVTVTVLYLYPDRHACARVTEWLVAIPPVRSLGIPLYALFVFLAGGLLVGLRLFWQRNAIESGFLWALAMALVACGRHDAPLVRTIWFATAGLCLVFALIEASHGMAFRDELTGLPGRRALEEACRRLGGDYAIAMVDVDHFKRFNDRYGHDVGDQVLKLVAARLGRVGGGGKTYRYGGEEFTVVFPGHDAEHAAGCVDEVRAVIAEWDFILRGPGRPRKQPDKPRPARGRRKRTRVTISAGVAQHGAHHGEPAAVIKAADRALYKAKEGGRNRVCR